MGTGDPSGAGDDFAIPACAGAGHRHLSNRPSASGESR
jgi:hypothetical protein